MPGGRGEDSIEEERYLVAAVVAGKQRATRAFVTLLAPMIERAGERAGLSGADLDDLTQDVWRHLWRANCAALRRWSGEGSISAYVGTIAYNKAMDHHRAKQRRRETVLAEDDLLAGFDDPGAAVDELWSLLEAGLAHLTETHRRIIFLRYVEGCSYTEIAERLERSPTYVGQTLKRAVARLKAAVQAARQSAA